MNNAARAYLKTEGKMLYRDCEIAYYTYSMFETPSKYRINVNVYLQLTINNTVKTLPLDESFDNEQKAIDYGIEQGKKCIDNYYNLGKIRVVKAGEESNKIKLDKLKPQLPAVTDKTTKK